VNIYEYTRLHMTTAWMEWNWQRWQNTWSSNPK